MTTEKPQDCLAVLKLDRRNGEERWALRCRFDKGHGGHHVAYTLLWDGDDR